jgi:hypothetical protein
VTLALAMAVAGCERGTLRSRSVDPESGEPVAHLYSDCLGAALALPDAGAGLEVALQIEDTRNAALRELSTDVEAQGRLTARLHNLGTAEIPLEITGALLAEQQPDGLPRSAEIPPGQARDLDLGRVGVNRYATELPVDLTFALGGAPQTWSLVLERRLAGASPPPLPWATSPQGATARQRSAGRWPGGSEPKASEASDPRTLTCPR